MRSDKLQDAIGEVRDDFIQDADLVPAKKIKPWQKWGAMAACICLIAAAAVSAPRLIAAGSDAPGGTGLPRTGPAAETASPVGSISEPNGVPEKAVPPADTASGPAELPYSGETGAPPTAEIPHAAENTPKADISGTEDDPHTVKRPESGADTPEGSPPQVYGPMLGPGDDPPVYTQFISGFGSFPREDMAVSNGSFHLSQALCSALAAYGDSVVYRVMVELFRDGVQIYSGSAEAAAEMERLSAAGYTVAFEQYCDGSTVESYFTLHATEAQLAEFSAAAGYGYNIMFYDEYFGITSDPLVDSGFNGGFAAMLP